MLAHQVERREKVVFSGSMDRNSIAPVPDAPINRLKVRAATELNSLSDYNSSTAIPGRAARIRRERATSRLGLAGWGNV